MSTRGTDRAAGRQAPRRTARSRVSASAGAPRERRRGIPFGLSTTRRAAMLATVVCALALSVAVPLRTYLSQRSEVAVQERLQTELHAKVEDLRRRKEQLADPEHTRSEARRRLRYVMPGETPYMVELPTDGPSGSDAATRRPAPHHAWYQELWTSVTGR